MISHIFRVDKATPYDKLSPLVKGVLLFIQLISAVLLIATVLLHSAKGEGLGGIGGQARIFGTQKGLEEGLDKITYTIAGSFILTSFFLSII